MGALFASRPGHSGDLVVKQIRPSDADPSIKRFDEPSFVLFDQEAAPASQLVVFLPGTDGKPGNAVLLLRQIAAQGYRVIGLGVQRRSRGGAGVPARSGSRMLR
jgi:hypothetical protein